MPFILYGAGAMMVAAQEMARVKREIDRQMQRMAARRAARHDAMRMAHLSPAVHETRAGFPCFCLCPGCGFIDRTEKQTCSACGREGIFNLTDEATAGLVRDQEERERHRSPLWVKLALALFLLLLNAFVIAWTWDCLYIFGTVLLGSPLAYGLLVRPLSVLALRMSPAKPKRWHMPMPLPGEKAAPLKRIRGKAETAGDLLTAPFTGRTCLAYQVSVLFDAPADARPPQWVLMETCGRDFKIGGTAIQGGNVMVRAPVRRVNPEEYEGKGLDLPRFLRERGLFDADGTFEIFEAVVEAEGEVEVSLYGETNTVVVAAAAGAA